MVENFVKSSHGLSVVFRDFLRDFSRTSQELLTGTGILFTNK